MNDKELWEKRKKQLRSMSKETLLECWKHCARGWDDCAEELEQYQEKVEILETIVTELEFQRTMGSDFIEVSTFLPIKTKEHKVWQDLRLKKYPEDY